MTIIRTPADAANVPEKQEHIVIHLTEPGGNFSQAFLRCFAAIERELEQGFAVLVAVRLQPGRNEQVPNLEGKPSRKDSWCGRVAEHRFEPNAKLTNLVHLIALCAVADIRDGLNICLSKVTSSIVREDQSLPVEVKLNVRCLGVLCILKQLINEMSLVGIQVR